MSNEFALADRWIYKTLSSDPIIQSLALGGVHAEIALDAVSPYIVFWQQSVGNDLPRIGGGRILTSPTYTIAATIEAESFEGIIDLADRIDQLLDRKQATVNGGQIVSCTRIRGFRRVIPAEGGSLYRQLGAQYQLQVQSDSF